MTSRGDIFFLLLKIPSRSLNSSKLLAIDLSSYCIYSSSVMAKLSPFFSSTFGLTRPPSALPICQALFSIWSAEPSCLSILSETSFSSFLVNEFARKPEIQFKITKSFIIASSEARNRSFLDLNANVSRNTFCFEVSFS